MATRVETDLAKETLRKLLKSLAELRQAILNPSAEDLYVKNLQAYNLRDVAGAIKAMALEPRESFQSAFPDLGTIIRRVEAIRDDRGRRPKFVSCGICKGGFIITADEQYTYAAECDCLKRWRGGEQPRAPDPIQEHLREVQEHPERFVPVDACIQVGRELALAKTQRKAAGKPMSDSEYRDLKRKLTSEMNRKWLEQLADRKTVAAGA